MIKIAYLTLEQYDLINGQYYSEIGIFNPIQDDVTAQYYITEKNIIETNVFEFLWVKGLELTNLPEYEQYKFKVYEI